MKRIKILKIELDKAPYEKEIDNKLEPLQEEVEGLIDCVYLEEGCVAVINAEAISSADRSLCVERARMGNLYPCRRNLVRNIRSCLLRSNNLPGRSRNWNRK